ncbi:MAG TPA: hypothetical protein VLN57_04475 [Xanthobacteraceae bacterium]|jgi:hypothetical protein|nr:hypothetical protein [Xanthobacteraceae bacterium]
MAPFLFSVGVVLIAAGLAAIGFGVPYNEFGTGNALIMSGTTSVVGGLIVFALGAVVRELRRLGRLSERAGPRLARPVDAEGASRAPARGALPPRPQTAGPPRRPPEQRPEPILPPDRPALELERPRVPNVPAGRGAGGEPPVVEEGELVPLSPAGLGRPSPTSPPSAGTRQTSRLGAARSQEPARPARNMFDPVWPSDASERPQPQDDSPPPPVAQAPSAGDTHEITPPADQGQAQPVPVAILKSGVIDGMGYTLYTDGSIEAQLSEGVMRFASIEELRVHLEKNG